MTKAITPEEVGRIVNGVFAEGINAQSERLHVYPEGMQSPGQWIQAVRKKAVIEAFTAIIAGESNG